MTGTQTAALFQNNPQMLVFHTFGGSSEQRGIPAPRALR